MQEDTMFQATRKMLLKSLFNFLVFLMLMDHSVFSTSIEEERAEIYRTSSKEIISSTIQSNPSDLISFDSKGGNPLGRICDREDLSEDDIIGLLDSFFGISDIDIDVNIAHQKTGKTALHAASSYNKVKVMEYLLQKKANINAPASDGATPLTMAVSFPGNFEAVSFLIQAGADVNLRTDNRNRVPVHIYNTTSYLGSCMAPIHYAVQEGLKDYVPLLLENGADINLKTEKGKGVFDFLKNSRSFNNITQSEYDQIHSLLSSYISEDGDKLSHVFDQSLVITSKIPTVSLREKIENADVKGLEELLKNSTREQIDLAFNEALIKPNKDIITLFNQYLPEEFISNRKKERCHLLFNKIIKNQKNIKERYEIQKHEASADVNEKILECDQITKNYEEEIKILSAFNLSDPQFLIKFLEEKGLKKREIAEMAGYSPYNAVRDLKSLINLSKEQKDSRGESILKNLEQKHPSIFKDLNKYNVPTEHQSTDSSSSFQ